MSNYPKAGDKLPDEPILLDIQANWTTLPELTKGKKAVFFAIPGAYTPLCTTQHLPGYIKEYEKIKAYGVDFIGCISVNDAWVMTAWNKSLDGEGKIVMICDPEAKFTKALNLVQNIKILGDRSLRYAMIVEDGVIVDIKVEDPGKFECSRASDIITLLEAQKK